MCCFCERALHSFAPCDAAALTGASRRDRVPSAGARPDCRFATHVGRPCHDRRDEPHPSPTPSGAASNGASAQRQRHGAAKRAAPSVRSGLAHRRNPALVELGRGRSAGAADRLPRPAVAVPAARLDRAGDRLRGAARGRSSRAARARQVPLSTVQKLAKQHQIASATLLDHDSRVEVTTTAARRDRPSADSNGNEERRHRTAVDDARPARRSSCGPPTRLPARRRSSSPRTRRERRERDGSTSSRASRRRRSSSSS